MIRVNDLDYSYSQQDHALKGISFEVKDQEWLSILGHNGSGKSTISKLLVGILVPQKGSIYYDDIELTEKQLIRYVIVLVSYFKILIINLWE